MNSKASQKAQHAYFWGGWATIAEDVIGFHVHQPRAGILGYSGLKETGEKIGKCYLVFVQSTHVICISLLGFPNKVVGECVSCINHITYLYLDTVSLVGNCFVCLEPFSILFSFCVVIKCWFLPRLLPDPLLYQAPRGDSLVCCQANDYYYDIFAVSLCCLRWCYWTEHHKDKIRTKGFVQQALNTQRGVAILESWCKVKSVFRAHSWDRKTVYKIYYNYKENVGMHNS